MRDINTDGFFTFNEAHRTASTDTVHIPYGFEFDTLAKRDNHSYSIHDNGLFVRVKNKLYFITGIDGTKAIFYELVTSMIIPTKRTGSFVTNGYNQSVVYIPDSNGNIDKLPSFVFDRHGNLVIS